MIDRIRTIDLGGLNKRFSSKFYEGFQIWNEGVRVLKDTPKENRKVHWPKHCVSDNKDEKKSPITSKNKK